MNFKPPNSLQSEDLRNVNQEIGDAPSIQTKARSKRTALREAAINTLQEDTGNAPTTKAANPSIAVNPRDAQKTIRAIASGGDSQLKQYPPGALTTNVVAKGNSNLGRIDGATRKLNYNPRTRKTVGGFFCSELVLWELIY